MVLNSQAVILRKRSVHCLFLFSCDLALALAPDPQACFLLLRPAQCPQGEFPVISRVMPCNFLSIT